eukprot:1161517-Pelagomonas_calceolata.AAC.12
MTVVSDKEEFGVTRRTRRQKMTVVSDKEEFGVTRRNGGGPALSASRACGHFGHTTGTNKSSLFAAI